MDKEKIFEDVLSIEEEQHDNAESFIMLSDYRLLHAELSEDKTEELYQKYLMQFEERQDELREHKRRLMSLLAAAEAASEDH